MIDRVSSAAAYQPRPSTIQARSANGEPLETFVRGDNPGPPAWGQSLTGDIRYHQVESKILNNSRGVWVYLPPDYHEHPDKNYPVLYLCDGQNMFEKGTAFGGVEWQADEAAQRLMSQGLMKDAILVAVSNTGARVDEYTQVANAADSPDPNHPGGKADEYGKFLIDELKPMIDSRYRTETKAESTGIAGSSLGGLVSLYLAFNNPQTFGLCGALSPSLWWAGRDLLKEIGKLPAGQGPQRVWLDMGTKESQTDENHNGVPDVIDDIRDMRDLLEKRGFNVTDLKHGQAPGPSAPGAQLLYWEVPGGRHDEDSWSKICPTFLASIYPRG